MDDEQRSNSEVIDEIIRVNAQLEAEWKHSYGWAPNEAAKLREESRIDWIVSLSHTLKIWVEEDFHRKQHDGRLILAWANLGALVEGTMKFFLSIYVSTYHDSIRANRESSVFRSLWDGKKAEPKNVDGLMLDVLREFFRREVWIDSERDRWDTWLNRIRDRRNTIHAYKERELGSFEEFIEDVRTYSDFLNALAGRLPDPPREMG